jgi:hypothetical protein
LEMSSSYSFGESHIGLAQASQIPEKVINSWLKSTSSEKKGKV